MTMERMFPFWILKWEILNSCLKDRIRVASHLLLWFLDLAYTLDKFSSTHLILQLCDMENTVQVCQENQMQFPKAQSKERGG